MLLSKYTIAKKDQTYYEAFIGEHRNDVACNNKRRQSVNYSTQRKSM